ncbi:cytochrome P450 [Crucibulum laeve]|uniref:Cytochrome P450 n=1 Tax=Crucibulum laeve TaxID=68775 RepID=A0A5C3LW72_9AGAR|nr:cytochrome P450 [Crucibulum laeve]
MAADSTEAMFEGSKIAEKPIFTFDKPRFLVLLLFATPSIVVLFNILYQQFNRKNYNLPPVVFHLFPFVGSAISYGKNPVKFFASCREKYGNVFTVVMLGRRLTVVLGARGNKFVLGTKSAIFNAEDAYRDFATPVFGKDVGYDVPNEVFMEQKRFLQFGLSTTNFRAYVGMIEDETQHYIQTNFIFGAVNSREEWSTFDSNYVMSEIIILTATRTLHGTEVREKLDGSVARYYSDLDGGLGPINFLFPHLPLPSYWRRDHAQRELSKFYISIIRKRKADTSGDFENDLMAALIEQRYRDGTPLKEHVIAHLMIALLMAGRHTSSATASWILIHLAANPHIANALYAEQVQVYRSPDNTLRPMTYDENRQLPLMNSVIRETLRIHPPIHSIMRYVRQDIAVPVVIGTPPREIFNATDDITYVVPKGHHILASPAISQKDPQIWRDASSWDPYRWTDPKGVAAEAGRVYESEAAEENDTKSEYIGVGSDSPYQPFGAGGHRCIGEQFANMQLAVIIGTFIRNFELRVASIPEHNYYTTVTLPMDGYIQFRHRKID